MEGWRLHGVGATLSSAIAAFLGRGDDVVNAVRKAHAFLQNMVIYAVTPWGEYKRSLVCHQPMSAVSVRQVELYNQLMALIAEHYKTERTVAFYAQKMNMTTKYVTQITRHITGKAPKQIISEYVMREIEQTLVATTLTIQEVAYMYGFGSQSLFCKYFHTIRGCSPSEFRSVRRGL